MNTCNESESVEIKERYSDTITKEIVSFLNGEGGLLIIGIKDDGTIVGVDKIDETLRKISDIITSQIESNPQDEIRTEIKFEQDKALIILDISKGSKYILSKEIWFFFNWLYYKDRHNMQENDT